MSIQANINMIEHQVCPHYLQNLCKFGQTCFKVHPCEHFLKGNCKMPPGFCKFPHLTLKEVNKLRVQPKKEDKPTQQVVEIIKSSPKVYGPPLPVKPMTMSFRDKITGIVTSQPPSEPIKVEPIVDEPVVDEPTVDEPVVDEPIVDDFTFVKGKFQNVTKHVPIFTRSVCKYFMMLDPVTQHHKCKYGVSGVNDNGQCPNLHPCYYHYTTGKCIMPKGKCKYPHVAKH